MQHESRPGIMSLVVWSALIPIVPFMAASFILDGPQVMLKSLVEIDLTTILSLIYGISRLNHWLRHLGIAARTL